MVRFEYAYHCGCGFQCSDAAKAAEHVRKTGHQMEVHGRVLPEGKVKRSL